MKTPSNSTQGGQWIGTDTNNAITLEAQVIISYRVPSKKLAVNTYLLAERSKNSGQNNRNENVSLPCSKLRLVDVMSETNVPYEDIYVWADVNIGSPHHLPHTSSGDLGSIFVKSGLQFLARTIRRTKCIIGIDNRDQFSTIHLFLTVDIHLYCNVPKPIPSEGLAVGAQP